MPIGLVPDDQFHKELESYKPKPLVVPPAQLEEATIIEGQVIDSPKRGRKPGDTNVPDSLRQIIAEEQLLNGRQSAVQLAADFGISPSSVSAYAVGATSTTSYDAPKPSIINHINKARERASKKAHKTLNAALQAITQEKLDYMDADKLSGVAKDMSVIIKNLEPKTGQEDGSKNQPQFVIFAPSFKKEENYEYIQVTE